MNCNQAREYLLDLAQAEGPQGEGLPPEAKEHLNSCSACAAELASLRATMSLLDEWQAPEVSPYFDQRLGARLREAAAQARAGWFAWLRKPALAAALALLMVMGSLIYRSAPEHSQVAQNAPDKVDTAVNDLKDLDQNLDMYANFDVLDELSTQTENP
jgi:anti-sigma factor RsiW